MVNVADAFGIELAEVAAPCSLKPLASTSCTARPTRWAPVTCHRWSKAAKAANPDAFVAWSYPPDTFGLTAQAKIENLDVKAFYAAVATAFPAYIGANGDRLRVFWARAAFTPTVKPGAATQRATKK